MIDQYAPCKCQSGKKFKFCCLPIIKNGNIDELASVNSKFPVIDCKVIENWQEIGITPVYIIREITDNGYVFISYLIDTWCLGLKDVIVKPGINKQTLNSILKSNTDHNLVSVTYQEARSIILGAIDYAKSIEIHPNGNWNKVASSFIESNQPYNQKFSFGKDGAPFYVSGPNDHENYDLKEIINKVTSRKGHYILAVE